MCIRDRYNTWEEIAENDSDFSIMTNSVANNGNPFGAADYAKNRNRILSTGINTWEYEGGYSYHGKSILTVSYTHLRSFCDRILLLKSVQMHGNGECNDGD